MEIMPEADRRQIPGPPEAARPGSAAGEVRRCPAFWTVEVDPIKAHGEELYSDQRRSRPARERTTKSQPGWPFAPATIDFREGRIEAFSDWLTAAENPLFARVAVNRLWQWHFGEGLHKTPSDFGDARRHAGESGLLDWLAAEFVARATSA